MSGTNIRPCSGDRGEFAAASTVAALYVYSNGVYAGLPDVDVWGEERDARLYDGPHPVVAHPPCKAWSLMANCRPEIVKGEDDGCFEAALRSVRKWGGVIEHPAHSLAWKRFALPKPAGAGWTRALFGDTGWSCEVDQRWYGHEANKPTWLYYYGDFAPDTLRSGRAPAGDKTVGRSWGGGRDHQRSGTPPAFRDVLLALARLAAIREDQLPDPAPHRRSVIDEARLCYAAHCEQMLVSYPDLRIAEWDDQDAAVREAWLEHVTPEDRSFA